MQAKKGGTKSAHRPTRAQIVQKSRKTRGLVNIGFSKHFRDSLREIATADDKTLISLLDEISARYISKWKAKQERDAVSTRAIHDRRSTTKARVP